MKGLVENQGRQFRGPLGMGGYLDQARCLQENPQFFTGTVPESFPPLLSVVTTLAKVGRVASGPGSPDGYHSAMGSLAIEAHGETVLRGDRVVLTPLTTGDLDELVRIGLDPRIWEWSPFPIQTKDDIRGYVSTALEERAEGRSLPFVTRHRESGSAIGCTRFGNIALRDLRAEIGWTWVAPEHWRTGANAEAKLLMLNFAFETLGLRRVEFKTDERNVRSRTAIEALGATFEGTLRKHMITEGGGVRNSVYYSILDEEWPETKEHLQARRASAPG